MTLREPLIPGRLVRRYQRFLADVEIPGEGVVTAHCPNSGSMMGLLEPGSPVLLTRSRNPKRKLAFTWQFVRAPATWVCINTLLPNRMIREALQAGRIPELRAFSEIRPEAVWAPGCRFDFSVRNGREEGFVEVKNVTLVKEGVARFPDAPTDRGRKHLEQLMRVAESGRTAAVCFLVNREDGMRFRPAEDIDPRYAETLRRARDRGVVVLVYRARVRPPEVEVSGPLAFEL